MSVIDQFKGQEGYPGQEGYTRARGSHAKESGLCLALDVKIKTADQLCPRHGNAASDYFHLKIWISAGVRMTMNSAGMKNTIIGTVSFGGSDAAFFSAAFMR